ncbi:MAG: CCA tRNA nucleotidyltransferase [Hyphomicrobium sp.]|jgi:poly(A) polymerase
MARSKVSADLPNLANAEWLKRQPTRELFAALSAEGAGVRAVGGAVRNTLMGVPVEDVDIATTARPDEVMALAKRAGLHVVPTGIEHGTVTVIVDKIPFEVTTLRRDIETFGRHARVTFTTDWREDAMRRDFTMNALYCDADGVVHDPLGGYSDLSLRRVKFIGDAGQRIREDYLRILRFFRFLAQYGEGTAPDAQALAAARAEKTGLAQLSAERIRAELLLLLRAPGAVTALTSMRENGLIKPLIGVAGDVAAMRHLAAIETELGQAPDAVLRLAALATGAADDLRDKLRLSGAEAERLANASRCSRAFDPRTDEADAKAFIYRHGAIAFVDGALLDWARSDDPADDAVRAKRVRLPQRWSAPELPVRGADIMGLGIPAGPPVGRVLSAFEEWWIAAGFPLDRRIVDEKLAEIAHGELDARRNA